MPVKCWTSVVVFQMPCKIQLTKSEAIIFCCLLLNWKEKKYIEWHSGKAKTVLTKRISLEEIHKFTRRKTCQRSCPNLLEHINLSCLDKKELNLIFCFLKGAGKWNTCTSHDSLKGVCMKTRKTYNSELHANLCFIFFSCNISQEEILALSKTKKVCVASIIIFCQTYFLQIILMTAATNCCEWVAECHENISWLCSSGSS